MRLSWRIAGAAAGAAAVALLVGTAGCGDDSASPPDGPPADHPAPDAAPDAPPPDAAPDSGPSCERSDGGMCPPTVVQPPGTCARTFGANLLVSDDSAAYGQNGETSVAGDGQGHIVTAWIASHNTPTGELDKTGVAYSDDNGATFTRGPELGTMNAAHNDPVVIADVDGSFSVVWLGYDNNPGNDHIWGARSTDHGHTFGSQTVINDAQDQGLDKPWAYLAPDASHTIFVTYDANPRPGSTASQSDFVTWSTDHGTTWAPAVQVSLDAHQFANLARMASDGTSIWLSYIDAEGDVDGDVTNVVYVRRMNIATHAFDTPVRASAQGESVVFQDPAIVSTQGGLDIVYVVGRLNGSAHVRHAHSADGITWQQTGNVDDDGCGGVHMLPGLAAGANGDLHVVFYDNRFSNPRGVFWYARSTDGQTFGPNEFVTDAFFPFTTNRATDRWLGDYVGIAVAGTSLYTTWTDPRNGLHSQVYRATGTVGP